MSTWYFPPQLRQRPEVSVSSAGSVYHGTDSASVVCGVTGFPPPHNLTWSQVWPGQPPEHHHQDYTSTSQEDQGHHMSLTYNLNMSHSNSSSQVDLTCSACNSLGCGRSPTLTLYIVGKTSITATRWEEAFHSRLRSFAEVSHRILFMFGLSRLWLFHPPQLQGNILSSQNTSCISSIFTYILLA